jgi:hypothetical protein
MLESFKGFFFIIQKIVQSSQAWPGKSVAAKVYPVLRS